MRRRPVLLGALLIIAALAIQINYDNQFKTLMLGTSSGNAQQIPANAANAGALQQRILQAGGFGVSADSYIRFSSYLIGTGAIMSILIGALLPEKKAEVS